jgi:hypothetical protein
VSSQRKPAEQFNLEDLFGWTKAVIKLSYSSNFPDDLHYRVIFVLDKGCEIKAYGQTPDIAIRALGIKIASLIELKESVVDLLNDIRNLDKISDSEFASMAQQCMAESAEEEPEPVPKAWYLSDGHPVLEKRRSR